MAKKNNLLKGLTMPTSADYKVETDEKKGGDYAKITAYPFDRGFGTTIGNTLRRILLSSIQGYAVSAIRFTVRHDGKTTQVSNEFESLPGVAEDILDIIASLKQLCISVPAGNGEPIQFTVPCKGPGELKGADFECAGLSIANKDLHVLTMESDVDMDIEVQVDFGRGYVPSDQKEAQKEQYAVIAIDSVFSPVKRVNFSVEPIRVGSSSEYDKLVMEVFTNGSIKASDAVAQAAAIATAYLKPFINFDATILQTIKDEEAAIDPVLLETNLDNFGIDSKIAEVLKQKNIFNVKHLISKTEEQLLSEGVTEDAVATIKNKLADRNLTLGVVSTRLVKNK